MGMMLSFVRPTRASDGGVSRIGCRETAPRRILAPSSHAMRGRGGSAVLVGDEGAPGVLWTRRRRSSHQGRRVHQVVWTATGNSTVSPEPIDPEIAPICWIP